MEYSIEYKLYNIESIYHTTYHRIPYRLQYRVCTKRGYVCRERVGHISQTIWDNPHHALCSISPTPYPMSHVPCPPSLTRTPGGEQELIN